MEEDLCSKMKEFMTVIDQVKKNRALLKTLPDFAIIIAFSFILGLSASIANNFSIVFITYIGNNPTVANSLTTLVIIVGVIIAVLWVSWKMRKVSGGQWQVTLSEGAPGAIRLLQELNWDDLYAEIRYAKLGFWLYGILKTAAYWLVIFVLSWFIAGFFTIYWNPNLVIIALFSLAIVLAARKNDLKKRFDQIGRLDALMWELRWFDYEFRRSDFQA